ncbi:MAG: hypothetical protein EOR73_14415 [Mesorhizobium sp.]|nr:MAG: hypothetical protein EOR73_14415 [Mesorhizobium sp.]
MGTDHAAKGAKRPSEALGGAKAGFLAREEWPAPHIGQEAGQRLSGAPMCQQKRPARGGNLPGAAEGPHVAW